MTLTSILLQAVASLLAIITFLIVLNVQRSMLLPGGVLGMGVWLLYLVLKEPTNVIVATFIAAVVGSGSGLCLGHSCPLGARLSILSNDSFLCDRWLQSCPYQCNTSSYVGSGHFYRDGKWNSDPETLLLYPKTARHILLMLSKQRLDLLNQVFFLSFVPICDKIE